MEFVCYECCVWLRGISIVIVSTAWQRNRFAKYELNEIHRYNWGTSCAPLYLWFSNNWSFWENCSTKQQTGKMVQIQEQQCYCNFLQLKTGKTRCTLNHDRKHVVQIKYTLPKMCQTTWELRSFHCSMCINSKYRAHFFVMKIMQSNEREKMGTILRLIVFF